MLSPKDLQTKVDEFKAAGLTDISPVEAQLLAATIVADALIGVATAIADGAREVRSSAMLRG
ncbi:MAG: hypothetical protein ACREMZ_11225 [Gemmatimonadales bacterium]